MRQSLRINQYLNEVLSIRAQEFHELYLRSTTCPEEPQ